MPENFFNIHTPLPQTDDGLSEELIEQLFSSLSEDQRALNTVICTLLSVKHDDNRCVILEI